MNLIGAFLAIKYAGRHMVKQGSGSSSAPHRWPGCAQMRAAIPIAQARPGVISLVQTAANSFFGSGVRVNAICPGLIETGMTKPIFDYARGRGTAANLGQLNPLRRYGEPRKSPRWRCSSRATTASYVNGQAIAVDGGLSSTHPFRRPRP